jgi:phosphoglycolate phosphatase
MSLPESCPGGLPGAIVWDLDGTLVDSAPDLATALNTLLGERGYELQPLSRVRPMIGNGVPKLLQRGLQAAGRDHTPERVAALLPRFMQIYSRCATHRTRPYPFVRRVLAELDKLGVRQGVCTNKPEKASRQILDQLDLAKFFRSIVGGDTTAVKKPDPMPLHTCLDELGMKTGDSLLIGDSEVDVQTGIAAGIPVAVVNWGYARSSLAELDADFIITHLPDLTGQLAHHYPDR